LGKQRCSVTSFTAVRYTNIRIIIKWFKRFTVTGQKKTAYEKFQDAETVDVGLIVAGTCSATHIGNLITIAEQ
jgi:hypothetical protein